MDLAGFSQMLAAFTADNNTVRNEAERAYHAALAASPHAVMMALVDILVAQPDTTVRSVAAVMVRQFIRTHWVTAPADMHKALQDKLLACFAKEPEALLRRRLCHAIAQVCSMVPEGDTEGVSSWATTVLPMAVAACHEPDAPRRASGIFLVAKTLEFSPEGCIKAQAQPLQEAFCRLLADTDAEVRVNASKTAAQFLIRLDSKEFRAAIAPLGVIATVLGVFGGFLQAGDEQRARAILGDLDNIACITPTSFKPHLAEVLAAVKQVTLCDTLDVDTRKMALGLLVTIAEAAGGMVRKQPALVNTAVELCLRLMMLSDEDETWASQAYDPAGDGQPSDPGDGDECATRGTHCLARLADVLRGEAVMPVFMAALPALLAANTWQAKWAVLTAVGVIADGCGKHMAPHLPAIVDMVVTLSRDPHQRVRHTAATTAGLLSSSFSCRSKFAVTYGPALLPAMAALMQGADNAPRTRAHAATAVINFCMPQDADVDVDTHCPPAAVVPHLRALVPALVAALGVPMPSCQRQVLFAVNALAQAAQHAFGEFYDGFSGGLQGILSRPVATPDDRLVLSAAMRCLAQLGTTVPAERFMAQGAKAMEGIVAMHKAGQLNSDDPFAIEVQKAATQICKNMGDACGPYLPIIVPPLLAAAQWDIDLSHEDVEEDSRAAPSEHVSSVVFEIKGYGHKRVNVNTTAIGERTAALRMLNQFVSTLGAPFLPFVRDTYTALRPTLDNPWVNQARFVATEMVPDLVRLVLDNTADDATAHGMAKFIIDDALTLLVKAMMTERDDDCRLAQVETVNDLMNICANTPNPLDSQAPATTPPPVLALPMDKCRALVESLRNVAMASMMRRQAFMDQLDEKEDVDELEREAMEEVLEVERDIMTNYVDACGYMLKSHRAAFLPLFNEILKPMFVSMCTADNLKDHTSVFHNGVCALIDVIEWCGPAGLEVLPALLPCMLAGAASEDASVRQACLYGIGIVCRTAPAALAPHQDNLLRLLHALVTAPDARDEDSVLATENAVSTLAKMLVHLPISSRDSLVGLWLSALPMREDEDEAQYNNALLCDMLEKGDPALAPHSARIVGIFGDVLAASGGGGSEDSIDLVDEATMGRIVAFLKANTGMVAAAAGGLSDAQKAALQAAMA